MLSFLVKALGKHEQSKEQESSTAAASQTPLSAPIFVGPAVPCSLRSSVVVAEQAAPLSCLHMQSCSP